MYKLKTHYSHHVSQNRTEWEKQRYILQNQLAHHSSQRRKIVQTASKIFPISLFDSWGRKNMHKIKHNEIIFHFHNLPKKFHNFSILHISDPHFNADSKLTDTICNIVATTQCDLTVLTGDYQFGYGVHPPKSIEGILKVADASSSQLPVLAVLGNHDQTDIIEHCENERINFLTNQLVSVQRDDEEIFIYGIDETLLPNRFNKNDDHFGICLGHSVEYAKSIAQQGWDLMLGGHSHGGQICLPFGIPIFLSVKFNRHIAIGQWNDFGMQGYTSKGCGTSGLPWRFNCNAEITTIYLKNSYEAEQSDKCALV